MRISEMMARFLCATTLLAGLGVIATGGSPALAGSSMAECNNSNMPSWPAKDRATAEARQIGDEMTNALLSGNTKRHHRLAAQSKQAWREANSLWRRVYAESADCRSRVLADLRKERAEERDRKAKERAAKQRDNAKRAKDLLAGSLLKTGVDDAVKKVKVIIKEKIPGISYGYYGTKAAKSLLGLKSGPQDSRSRLENVRDFVSALNGLSNRNFTSNILTSNAVDGVIARQMDALGQFEAAMQNFNPSSGLGLSGGNPQGLGMSGPNPGGGLGVGGAGYTPPAGLSQPPGGSATQLPRIQDQITRFNQTVVNVSRQIQTRKTKRREEARRQEAEQARQREARLKQEAEHARQREARRRQEAEQARQREAARLREVVIQENRERERQRAEQTRREAAARERARREATRRSRSSGGCPLGWSPQRDARGQLFCKCSRLGKQYVDPNFVEEECPGSGSARRQQPKCIYRRSAKCPPGDWWLKTTVGQCYSINYDYPPDGFVGCS